MNDPFVSFGSHLSPYAGPSATRLEDETLSQRVARLYGEQRAEPAAVDVVLAPMVRAGTLPLRLLCLGHGATAVYSEELVAKKIRKARRVVNSELGTIDFVVASHVPAAPPLVVYRTCAMERGMNILQIGSADPQEAAESVEIFKNDVAAFDLNMGCPQHFSMAGGMGAALLETPEVACAVVKAMRAAAPKEVPISCKIRLLETPEKTVELMRRLVEAGASAFAVHARRVPERPRHPARWSELREIVSRSSVPVVVNGDAFCYQDALEMARLAGVTRVMTARGAQADFASPFRPAAVPYASVAQLSDAFTLMSELCDNHLANTKWHLLTIVKNRFATPGARGGLRRAHIGERNKTPELCLGKTLPELCDVYKLAPRPTREQLWEQVEVSRDEHGLPDRASWIRVTQKALALVDRQLPELPGTQALKRARVEPEKPEAGGEEGAPSTTTTTTAPP